jgi:PII-like signaling protein
METIKLKKGMRLYTKDGRKIGNARITSSYIFDIKHPTVTPFVVYRIKTDFGNKAELNADEIQSLFYLKRN